MRCSFMRTRSLMCGASTTTMPAAGLEPSHSSPSALAAIVEHGATRAAAAPPCSTNILMVGASFGGMCPSTAMTTSATLLVTRSRIGCSTFSSLYFPLALKGFMALPWLKPTTRKPEVPRGGSPPLHPLGASRCMATAPASFSRLFLVCSA